MTDQEQSKKTSIFIPETTRTIILSANSGEMYVMQYEEIFKTYFSALCYFARNYITDMDDCKEIVHKVFVNIWENRETFDFEKSAKSYLYTAVYNRCMNHIRDVKKFKNVGNIDVLESDTNYSVNTDHLEAAELEAKIWEIIHSLPAKCREIFILSRFEEKKYSEIAEYLNISVKTVESQMTKALSILRENLRDYLHLFLFLILKNLW